MSIKRSVHGVGYNGGGRHVISVKTVRTHTYMYLVQHDDKVLQRQAS